MEQTTHDPLPADTERIAQIHWLRHRRSLHSRARIQRGDLRTGILSRAALVRPLLRARERGCGSVQALADSGSSGGSDRRRGCPHRAEGGSKDPPPSHAPARLVLEGHEPALGSVDQLQRSDLEEWDPQSGEMKCDSTMYRASLHYAGPTAHREDHVGHKALEEDNNATTHERKSMSPSWSS
jgi:hypothetical protein